MPNKMLIDASHPEETRVVVLRGNRIEEFDFESQDKKQLRGNIYLARVTRVEPSLQAAFVEYGGNRHGFLAFSEIHPDYYQIPVADRQALLDAEAAEASADDDDAADETEQRAQSKGGRKRRRGGTRRGKAKSEAVETDDETNGDDENSATKEPAPAIAAAVDSESVSEPVPQDNGNGDDHNGDEESVDVVGAEDALDEAQNRRRPTRRNYKIQEVIKRRQILLVQVVKEERGNKGAALTTYLSLAGRYSVLMPNTARGGGISRKITNAQDRKRLKDVVRGLEVPKGMGVILRTAGANRTKAEVKRDYDYLMRLWEKVRTLTLESTAPALVYEEGSLIKRSVRDLYNKDIDQILVSGEDGYREAKDFMRMLMPSHAKVVQPYRDETPIFAGSGIEAQLDRMLQPQVTLKSGGYIIINQTEALVAIDVNSGRSTKEHSIEDTALQTNLEAAEEVARQLRLRDLAGLIVIDFIDMEENRNNRAVEKRLKDCLKNDRARIQVGRISHFGLLEMSRQRIRASVLESTMQPCPHCGGTGHIRSESSVALYVARAIEEYLLKDARNNIVVRTPASTALYLLNHKRANLVEMESRFSVSITVEADETVGAQHLNIVKQQAADKLEQDQPAAPAEAPAQRGAAPAADMEESDDGENRKRRRKRRRRGGRNRGGSGDNAHRDESAPEASENAYVENAVADLDSEANDNQHAGDDRPEDGGERKKRHRGKRGGRKNRRENAREDAPANETEAADDGKQLADSPQDKDQPEAVVADSGATEPESNDTPPADKPARKPRRRSRKSSEATAASPAEATSEPQISGEAEEATVEPATEKEASAERKKPTRRRKPAAKSAKADSDTGSEETPPPVSETAASEAVPKKTVAKQSRDTPPSEPVVSSSGPEEKEAPRRTGWWQRKSFF